VKSKQLGAAARYEAAAKEFRQQKIGLLTQLKSIFVELSRGGV